MSIYVDDMKAPFGRMLMCHMIADTHDELVAMADKIGVARRWIQGAGTNREHFDIALSKKKMAVAAGAIEIEYGCELAEMLKQRDRGEKMIPRHKKERPGFLSQPLIEGDFANQPCVQPRAYILT